MSSEQDRRRLGFGLTVALAITALSLAVVGLTVANAAQGPRLLGVDVNPRAAVERPGQLLLLQADQSLTIGEPSQVSITPAVPVEVAGRGATLEVRFVAALQYATEYQVSAAVTSAATGARSTFTHTFHTPPAELYVLQRNGSFAQKTPDDIVRIVPDTSEKTVVFSAPRIQQFAVSGSSLAVITQDTKYAGTLAVGPVNGSGTWKTLATNSYLSQLQASEANGVFGYVSAPLSGAPEDQAELHIYDPGAGDRLTGVVGLDGKRFDPEAWAFVPGTRAIVAQTSDALFFLIDPVTGSVKPLGGYNVMHGFANGTPTLILEKDGRYIALDLATGKHRNIPLGDLAQSAVIDELLARPDGGYASLVTQLEDDALRFSIVTIDQGKSTTIYAPEPADSLIPTICLSPNGQLLAVEDVPPGNETDGNDVLPGYRKSRIVIIDAATGNYQDEEAGFGANWCH